MKWQRARGEHFYVSVNLSAAQLRQASIVDEVAVLLAETGIATGSLVLEITESVLMHHTDKLLETLHQLKELGIRLALDDFGTGYSSLSYLRRFPLDMLKIPKNFIDNVTSNQADSALAAAIVDLGRNFMLTTVAEGIEEAEQLEHVKRLRCDLGQGYLFARPLPAPALDELLDAADEPIGSSARSASL